MSQLTVILYGVVSVSVGLFMLFWAGTIQGWAVRYRTRHPYSDWERRFLLADEQWLETKAYTLFIRGCGIVVLCGAVWRIALVLQL